MTTPTTHTDADLYVARSPEPTSQPRGHGHQLGVTIYPDGIDVAVVAGHATLVEFCAVDVTPSGLRERRFRLNQSGQGVWSAFIPHIYPGQRYGFRAHGKWDPASGMQHNPAKLLLDPYGKGIAGEFIVCPAVYAHTVNDDLTPIEPMEPSPLDSAPYVPHSVVTSTDYDGTVAPLHTPWDRTVIYEAHVKGLTMNLPGVPDHLRGTYAGLAHPATIEHLTSLGVTAIELLPIHAKVNEAFLDNLGLTNYWGYNTAAFFAPEPSYATAQAQEAGPDAVLREVKGMVDLLHQAGIEVLMDVVYNHTCEGGIDGPTLSWKGLDPLTYYLREHGKPGLFMDVTGCGNSLDFRRRRVIQMTLDSLRYWADEVGIDGFRFDLAVTLGRQGRDFNSHHPFLVALSTDPILGHRKLINEPWDIGPNGWRTGEFPAPMADWNDRFRDAVRRFWIADQAALENKSRGGDLREIVTRLSGSADLFSGGRLPGGRGASASINFVTAHDGFTLADLTTYNHKHNEANLEGNRDGSDSNNSWNHGTEGPDPELIDARTKTMRNMLGTLILAAGTPMITAGDEFGRSQGGNNNAYCQDNDISWVDWDLEPWQRELMETTRHLLRLRSEHKVLRPTSFYSGTPVAGDALPDVAWLDRSGTPMPAWKWFDPGSRVLQMMRSGYGTDTDALVIFNGSLAPADVTLPAGRGLPFDLVWDSAHPLPPRRQTREAAQTTVTVPGQSMRLYLSNPA